MTRNTLVLAKLMFAVVIAAGLVALPLYLRSMADRVDYNQGRANSPPNFLPALYHLGAALATWVLPVAALGTAARLRRWDRAVERHRWVEPAVCVVLFLLVFLGQETGRRLIVRPVWPWKLGFRDWVRAEVDLPRLRETRKRLIATGETSFLPSECPPDIQRSNPGGVYLFGETLSIVWGGGFMHWYLEVGPPSDKTTTTEDDENRVADDMLISVD